MLFTDGPFITANDLNVIDGEFIKLATQAGILVDGSSDSIITRTILAAGSEVTGKFQNFSGYLVGVGVASNHLAAVLNVLSTAINRPRAFLQQIPVIEPNPTRSAFIRWVKYYCLYDFYQSLYMRNVKEERFGYKMDHYNKERTRRWKELCGNGIPVVLNPFSCPGAVWDYGAGTWGASNITTVVQSGPAGGTFFVAITWAMIPSYQSLALQNGNESGPSYKRTMVVAINHVLSVNLSNLNPPTGIMQPAIGTAQGIYPPQQATHWNVYVGANIDTLHLQNPTPIPIATTTYQLAADPTTSGGILNPGQPAQFDFSAQNVIWRG